MNTCCFIGRMVADPELRTTNSGTSVATYRIAVDRQYKKEGQPEADFITCVAWGKNGEFVHTYFHKGMKIAVVGSLQIRSYDDKDGKKVYVSEIIVDRQEFCESKKSASAVADTASDFSNIDDLDDLPFI